MNINCIAATNNVDLVGDILNLDSIDSVITHHNPLVTRNFNLHEVIGKVVEVDVKDGKLHVSLDVVEGNYSGLYPCIGFKAISNTKNKDKGYTYHQIKLYEVSLCSNNVDKSIKPLP